MVSTRVEKLETDIQRLTLSGQLYLLERLAQNVRTKTAQQQHLIESQIEAMAADPDIQRELKDIEAEFLNTELDGLGDSD